ncbi:ankyrin repeat protein [Diplodia corticola]|uniref:Ankyrin repeat protein n=1 Tax=Diplodia corticola TaxID=236234 RepID=A0A1J9RW64_9PEZI|nr:ankyrin repeat protein [Diplodia corticola]OJD31717.1 ankyrin repeat protein [Diplodia corticola]
MESTLQVSGSSGVKRHRDDSDDNVTPKSPRLSCPDLPIVKSSGQPKTFRVRHVPYWCMKEAVLHDVLSRVLHLNCSNLLHIASIASNPISPEELVATISFQKIPELLSVAASQGQKGNEWRIERTEVAWDGNVNLTFDTHFLDITPYHNREDSSYSIDVIALSGLNGHAFGSFKERNGSFMWIRDALPVDLPRARIFTYGYDTSILDSQSFQSISHLGMKFREALRCIRNSPRNSSLERPLVLVCHSLGGLVAKEAIIQMADKNAHGFDITNLRSIVGVLLFGVPRKGMAIESLLPMAKHNPNEALLRTLEENSEVLRCQSEQFPFAFPWTDSKVYSFFETMRSPTAKKSDGKWAMKGPPAVLVCTESAIHGRFPAEKKEPFIYAINQSHSAIVKFTSRDSIDYQAVLSRLRELDHEAQTIVHARHNAATPDLANNTERPYQHQACLESLAFAEQLQRQDEVLTAKLNGTCRWLLTHHDYLEWLAKRQGLLWIQGNPGVGKSTAMKFIVDDVKARSRVTSHLVISFFFHGRGASIQKSVIGLYRSLLNQLLAKAPGLLSELTKTFQERCDQMGRPGKDWNWGEGELHQFIKEKLPKLSRERPITVCVDALDECGKEAAIRLVAYAKDLLAQASSVGGSLKICFACRRYPRLNLCTNFTIWVEEENSLDIHSVVSTHLPEDLSTEAKDELVEKISQKARGVFQWAVLVASQVMQLHMGGERVQVIKRRIDEIPPELHQLYGKLLSTFSSAEDRAHTLKLFQWLCFSRNPLSAHQLQHALAIDAAMPHKSVAEYQNGDQFADDARQLEVKVINFSRGLAQIINNRAQFIHESVTDYLLEDGFRKLQSGLPRYEGSSDRHIRGHGHFDISRSCIRYLKLQEIMAYPYPDFPRQQSREEGFQAEQDLETRFPLLRYAIFSLPWHIAQVEASGLAQVDLLQDFCWPNDGEMVEKLAQMADVIDFLNNEWRFDWPVEGSRLIHLICEIGITSAFNAILNSPEVATDETP